MGERSRQVVEHLDAALKAAENANMSTSHTIGMFFYYAHNLAQQALEAALEKTTAE
ncbi:MAG: hypothetical protein ACTSX7_07150 [Alphaproteobacteria bacterium]